MAAPGRPRRFPSAGTEFHDSQARRPTGAQQTTWPPEPRHVKGLRGLRMHGSAWPLDHRENAAADFAGPDFIQRRIYLRKGIAMRDQVVERQFPPLIQLDISRDIHRR